jgi:hypothetical protein
MPKKATKDEVDHICVKLIADSFHELSHLYNRNRTVPITNSLENLDDIEVKILIKFSIFEIST